MKKLDDGRYIYAVGTIYLNPCKPIGSSKWESTTCYIFKPCCGYIDIINDCIPNEFNSRRRFIIWLYNYAT